jgi:predicted Abi (CAAX) family protease
VMRAKRGNWNNTRRAETSKKKDCNAALFLAVLSSGGIVQSSPAIQAFAPQQKRYPTRVLHAKNEPNLNHPQGIGVCP